MKRILFLLIFVNVMIGATEINVQFLPDQEFQVQSELFLKKIGLEGSGKSNILFVSLDIPPSDSNAEFRIKTISEFGITLEKKSDNRTEIYFFPMSRIRYIKAEKL